MPNLLTFTTPVQITDMKHARIAKAREIDDTVKRLVLDVQILGDDDIYHPTSFAIEVTNGTVTRVHAKANPTSTMDIFEMGQLDANDNEDIATAFDSCMQAYFTGGLTAVLDRLQDLGALPAGTAA